jgi:SAM-dependent methyltransferase
MATTYRARIYSKYSSARHVPLAPLSIEGLTPRAPYLQRLIRKHFPSDLQASIVDLGCGHGAIVHFARQAGYVNVRGVDDSPEQVAAARRLGIEEVTEGDLVRTLSSMPDASQDCIVTFDVIEHFTRDELIELVDEVRRVLQPGGRWIIHTPNGESPFCGRMRYGDLTHELIFTHTSIEQLLYSSGFSGVQCYEDEPVLHGLKSIVRGVFWKVIRNALRFYIAVEMGYSGKDGIFSQNFLVVAIK